MSIGGSTDVALERVPETSAYGRLTSEAVSGASRVHLSAIARSRQTDSRESGRQPSGWECL